MKKRIPYILAMILMIPFFVLAVFASGSQGEGKTITDTNMSMKVIKENGVLNTYDGMPVYADIEEPGEYTLSFSWDAENPGFLTGITIKDENGKCVYSDTAFQLNISGESIYLEKGRYVINYEFFTSEEEFLKFNDENKSITEEAVLKDYIKDVGFDSFEEDSECTFSFSVKLNKQYTSPLWVKVLCILMGAAVLALCVLTLILESKKDENIGEGVDKVSVAFAVFSIAVTFVQLFLSFGINLLPIKLSPNTNSLLTFLLVLISVDAIGFPIIYGITKNIEKREIPKQKLGFFKFIPFIFMTFALLLIGMVVGTVVNNLFTLPFGGNNTSVIAELLLGSSMLPRVIVVGILAPVFEELIFRKILIDRLSRYGSFVAIAVSGLFFGLFHGNFSQFFFAMLIGFLFAFVYLKTGKIHLTIILHMIVNLTSSIVTTSLLQNLLKYNPSIDLSTEYLTSHPESAIAAGLYGAFMGFLVLLAVIGVVFIIIFAATKRFRLEKTEGEATKGEALKAVFTSKYAWLFILSAIGLFLFTYLPAMRGI